ncbi:hypothetical protein BC940DRAFT_323095 [Gongronella butleri]|nr:hypothetical protein BC940DRAFT_323095 [Gongronella butleri]
MVNTPRRSHRRVSSRASAQSADDGNATHQRADTATPMQVDTSPAQTAQGVDDTTTQHDGTTTIAEAMSATSIDDDDQPPVPRLPLPAHGPASALGITLPERVTASATTISAPASAPTLAIDASDDLRTLREKTATARHKRAEALEAALDEARAESERAKQAYVVAIANRHPAEETKILERAVKDANGRVKSIKEIIKFDDVDQVRLPRNLPVLQFVGDEDVIPNKPIFTAIDKFIHLFELILYQHNLSLDDQWEQALISSIQHSTVKVEWFRHELMGRRYTWDQAKAIITQKFSGDHLSSQYLQELNAMVCGRTDNPLDFIEEFGTVLRAAGVQDSQAFGSMLLEKLDDHFERLTTQIRNIQAIPSRGEREALTVEYIRDRAPHVYSAKWDGGAATSARNSVLNLDRATRSNRQGRTSTRHIQRPSFGENRRRAQQFSRTTANRFVNRDTQGNSSVFSRLHDGNVRQSSSRMYGNAPFRRLHDVSARYDNARFDDRRGNNNWQQKRNQQTRPVSSVGNNLHQSSSSGAASRPPCRHCGREWSIGHKCAEFFAAKSARLDFLARSARAARDLEDGNYKMIETGTSKAAAMRISSMDVDGSTVGGTIILADGSRIPRLGQTVPLRIKHANVTIEHAFELLDSHPADDKQEPAYQVTIGVDIMTKLGIRISGLAVTHDEQEPELEADNDLDLPEPDNSPMGTAHERAIFMQKIQPAASMRIWPFLQMLFALCLNRS